MLTIHGFSIGHLLYQLAPMLAAHPLPDGTPIGTVINLTILAHTNGPADHLDTDDDGSFVHYGQVFVLACNQQLMAAVVSRKDGKLTEPADIPANDWKEYSNSAIDWETGMNDLFDETIERLKTETPADLCSGLEFELFISDYSLWRVGVLAITETSATLRALSD